MAVSGMTDQEKNEVIARWRGFFQPDGLTCWEYPHDCYPEEMTPRFRRIPSLPDFTDLTTLFKWCVPKLDCYRLFTHWGVDSHEPWLRTPTKFHDAEVETGHGNIATAMRYIGHGDTPGEALRDAILSLIGEGDVSRTAGFRHALCLPHRVLQAFMAAKGEASDD